MKMLKNLVRLLFICVIVTSLAGCWDQKELDQKAYVIAIGLDEAEQEGKIKVSYLIANPEVGSQQTGGGTNEPTQEIVSLVADDFISSRNTANAIIAREISYDLLQVMIVSEDFAANPNFIRWIYSAAKDREIKRSAKLIVSKEKAEKFVLTNKPQIETRPHKFFELMIERGQETGMIPDTDLNSYYSITESDADLFLAIYATTEKDESEMKVSDDDLMAGEVHAEGTTRNAQFIGSAVFKEGMMIGKITGEETRISSLLDNTWNTEDIMTNFQDPFNETYRISARVSQKRQNKYTYKNKYGRPEILIEVPLFVEILSDPSMINYAKNKGKVMELQRFITKKIEDKMNEYITRTQEEFKGDTFHLSVPIRRHFKTLPEFRDFDWMKSYPDAVVKVKVNIRFGEFGRQTKLPKLKEVRD
ncbi:Ger(x)C family spore germination protein [Heyndrickxia sp. MSNUG]|uniref:Ger(x)C family spore germination protein n=1 Tax=Heyndrickxia sp. MSNUG TaxID=3136677 RepID=UPI003C2C9291